MSMVADKMWRSRATAGIVVLRVAALLAERPKFGFLITKKFTMIKEIISCLPQNASWEQLTMERDPLRGSSKKPELGRGKHLFLNAHRQPTRIKNEVVMVRHQLMVDNKYNLFRF